MNNIFDLTPLGWEINIGVTDYHDFRSDDHFSISSQLQPQLSNHKEMSQVKKTVCKKRKNDNMGWRDRFKISLRRCLHQHLRRETHPLFGTRLYIVPFNSHVLMKIRLILSWVDDGHVLKLNYWGVLHLFEYYCDLLFPNEYNHKLKGPIYWSSLISKR